MTNRFNSAREILLHVKTVEEGFGSFAFKKPVIERCGCWDKVDCSILPLLFEAGSPEVLPNTLAARFAQ
jgi:hypothetical protein